MPTPGDTRTAMSPQLQAFFEEAARLGTRIPMTHQEMCAAMDAKDNEIARLRTLAERRLDNMTAGQHQAYSRLIKTAADLVLCKPLTPFHRLDDSGKRLVGRRALISALNDAEDRLKRMAMEMRDAADALRPAQAPHPRDVHSRNADQTAHTETQTRKNPSA